MDLDIKKSTRILSAKKEHANRNQKLCAELFEGKVYYDWVVTTAFYSAIHYVEDKILPLKINSIHCKSISDVRFNYKMPGRHAARERLVGNELPNVCPQYKWLDDKSRYSRYKTFRVTKNEADKAMQYLKEICDECCS